MLRENLRQRIRHYLVLVRLPNVFTVPTNILVGYFSLTGVADADAFHLSALMASSALLYVAGIVFNDYFDAKVDRKERPGRPIPSGKVSRQGALYLAVTALAAANAVALLVSPASLAISAALSAVIIAYNYRAKLGRFGPAVMGSARFLNVFLGASPTMLLGAVFPWTTLFAAGAMFAYVYAIALLSRREVGEHEAASYGRSVAQTFSVVAGVATSAVALAFYLEAPEMSVNIALFAAVMYLVIRRAVSREAAPAKRIQGAVKYMVLSIVILDSIFITAFAGLFYGVASLAIMLPAIMLAKKLYVT